MDFSLNDGRPAPRAKPLAVFRTPASDPLSRALACTGAGTQHVLTRLAGRRLGCHAAVLVDSGAGWLESEAGGRLRIEAPSLFFLFPGERHGYGPDPGSSWHEHWLLFEGRLVEDLAASGFLDRRRPVVTLADAAPFSARFRRIRDELTELGQSYAAAAAALVHELIVACSRANERPSAGVGSSPEEIAATIRAEALGPLDFGALAARFGMSEATLRRRMIASHAVSPKSFQLRVRMDRAKELLATTDTPVEAIARAVGFDDPYYFSRLFRHREGIAPSRFRSENRRA